MEVAGELSSHTCRRLLERTADTLKALGALVRGGVNHDGARQQLWVSSTDQLLGVAVSVFKKWVSLPSGLADAPLLSEALRLLGPTIRNYSVEAGKEMNNTKLMKGIHLPYRCGAPVVAARGDEPHRTSRL